MLAGAAADPVTSKETASNPIPAPPVHAAGIAAENSKMTLCPDSGANAAVAFTDRETHPVLVLVFVELKVYRVAKTTVPDAFNTLILKTRGAPLWLSVIESRQASVAAVIALGKTTA